MNLPQGEGGRIAPAEGQRVVERAGRGVTQMRIRLQPYQRLAACGSLQQSDGQGCERGEKGEGKEGDDGKTRTGCDQAEKAEPGGDEEGGADPDRQP